jgi:hypothetical protein
MSKSREYISLATGAERSAEQAASDMLREQYLHFARHWRKMAELEHVQEQKFEAYWRKVSRTADA